MKYIINGHTYANEPYYVSWDTERKYPFFKHVEEIELRLEANSLDEAYKWMLINLPAYAIGCAIRSEDGKSFRIGAEKGPSYHFLPNLEQDTIVAHELARLQKI